MLIYELFLLMTSNQPREVWWASRLSPEVQSVQELSQRPTENAKDRTEIQTQSFSPFWSKNAKPQLDELVHTKTTPAYDPRLQTSLASAQAGM